MDLSHVNTCSYSIEKHHMKINEKEAFRREDFSSEAGAKRFGSNSCTEQHEN